MTKEEEIKKEVTKLNKIFKDIPKEKQNLVEHLIQNAAFMSVTLKDLQKDIDEQGASIRFVSGNGFETIRENPSQKSYTSMVAKYAQIINQLNGYLPDSKSDAMAKAGEALAAFVAKGK